MIARPCYTRDELKRYLLGRADDALSAAIEGHLEACPRCDDTLAGLDVGDDTLVRTLQVKQQANGARIPTWVAKLAETPFAADGSGVDQAAPSPVQPPLALGDYELLKVLGRGGMSVVFSARHKHLGREVALKILLPTTQPGAVSRDRFTREMRAVGGLDHPAIIRATDAGECEDTLYLVMERIEGVDLNHVSKAEGPLRVADACAICCEAARGLAHAHDQGVVHRDMKPSNLMLDRDGHVKILDFGLARMQSAACDVSLHTTMGQLLGTLDYMAPEQAGGCEVDSRADIYALGATLYKLLVGVPPHGRSADAPIIEFLHRLATKGVARLDTLRENMPGELVELVANMLQRDPVNRISSAEEVAARLEAFSAGADLCELMAGAADKLADASEEEVGITRSISELWSNPLPSREEPRPKEPRPKDSPQLAAEHRGWSTLGVWSALAAGFVSVSGIIALTIVLTLRSPEGEIRIESELENVKVEVVDAKDRVDVISVEHGTAVTTLRTGRYRIRLDSPADGLEVTPQEVIVTKDKVVIARVKKIARVDPVVNLPTPQRPPQVAMEAQLQLAQVISELEAAKQQPEPSPAAIKSLEEKLSRLRALSRPIPTEPVYEGRTLADWVAQMRFEQESSAQRAAASNVLKLAATRPSEEQIALIIEAGSRLYGWTHNPIDQRLYDEVTRGRAVIGSSAQRISEVERDVAAAALARALQSRDPDRSEYALTVCADLRDQFQQEAWPGVSAALEARSKSDKGPLRVASQLTWALCLEDPAKAASVLTAIDTSDASEKDVLAILYAADERKLEISREQQIAWVATYCSKLPYFSERYPDEFLKLWAQPTMGPFRDVQWDDVDVGLQEDVNAAVGPLLKTLAERLDRVSKAPQDMQQQINAGIPTNTLVRMIYAANLTGETRQQALELLNRRLDQLLQFRATSNRPPEEEMGKPQMVALAITLLAGEPPASLTRLHWDETGYLADQLNTERARFEKLENQLSQIQNASAARFEGRRVEVNLADWYPYEVLTIINNANNRLEAHRRELERQSTRAFRRTSEPPFLQTQRRRYWRVESWLMLDFAKTSASAAALVDSVVAANDFLRFMDSHPVFSDAVTKFMENADNQEAIGLGYKLWVAAHGDKAGIAKQVEWLKAGDAEHARFAVAGLASLGDKRIYLDWAPFAASAIDRIAETTSLNYRELTLLDALGADAPHAPEHAINYIRSWLKDPEFRVMEKSQRRLGEQSSSLRPCMNILLGAPDAAKEFMDELEALIEAAGRDSDAPLDAGDAKTLAQILRPSLTLPK